MFPHSCEFSQWVEPDYTGDACYDVVWLKTWGSNSSRYDLPLTGTLYLHMMLWADVLTPPGPPPQVVLNQRWLWSLLMLLLVLNFVLCLLGVDVSGALLSALMLWLELVMIKDGMLEIGRYALVYAILCALNFCFNLVPLLTEFNGRIQSQTEAETQKLALEQYR